MLVAFLAFLTGILVGLSGTGAGVILTPLLLVATPFTVVVVIGTDLLSGAATKLAGVIEHRRLGQVQWRLAAYLLSGSVPGTLTGILLIHILESHLPSARLDYFLRILLGATLLAVSIFLPRLRGRNLSRPNGSADLNTIGMRAKLAAAGAMVGFLVAMTSVGSGSLLMIALLVMVPLPFGDLVGTDILFGLVTTALAGSLHFEMGHFDTRLFLLLLAGEVPGVIVGSRLTRLIPDRYFAWAFSILCFSLGARLLAG